VNTSGDPAVHPNSEELGAAPLEGCTVLACTVASGDTNQTHLQPAPTMPSQRCTTGRHKRRSRLRLRHRYGGAADPDPIAARRARQQISIPLEDTCAYRRGWLISLTLARALRIVSKCAWSINQPTS